MRETHRVHPRQSVALPSASEPGGARERAQLLDIHPGVAVPLESVRVGVALEISRSEVALRSASATSCPDRCISPRSAHRFAQSANGEARPNPPPASPSRMMRSMYASGSSPDAAASCCTSSLARLTAPLGRPAPGRFPPCPFIVLSRGRSKTARRTISGSGSSVPQYGTVASAGQYGFRYREGASPFTGRARNTQVHHCPAD